VGKRIGRECHQKASHPLMALPLCFLFPAHGPAEIAGNFPVTGSAVVIHPTTACGCDSLVQSWPALPRPRAQPPNGPCFPQRWTRRAILRRASQHKRFRYPLLLTVVLFLSSQHNTSNINTERKVDNKVAKHAESMRNEGSPTQSEARAACDGSPGDSVCARRPDRAKSAAMREAKLPIPLSERPICAGAVCPSSG